MGWAEKMCDGAFIPYTMVLTVILVRMRDCVCCIPELGVVTSSFTATLVDAAMR